jgi:hypothetical protein
MFEWYNMFVNTIYGHLCGVDMAIEMESIESSPLAMSVCV